MLEVLLGCVCACLSPRGLFVLLRPQGSCSVEVTQHRLKLQRLRADMEGRGQADASPCVAQLQYVIPSVDRHASGWMMLWLTTRIASRLLNQAQA